MKKIEGGYILQPRAVDKSQVSSFPPVARELWFYLLRKVNYYDGKILLRGQGFFQLSVIQDDLCWYAGYRKMVYSKPQLTKSLRRLRESNMIATTKETRGVVVTVLNYCIYQDPSRYEGNDEGNMKEIRKKRQGRTISKEEDKKKEEIKHICVSIIDYLNKKTGKNFRKVDSTITLIAARLREGHSEQDFYNAIDNQVAAWKGDNKMEQFIRPATLFQKQKFDGYVNNIAPKGSEWDR